MAISPKMLAVLKSMKRTRGVGSDLNRVTKKALLRRGLIELYAPGKVEADGRRGHIVVASAVYALTEKGIAACS